MLKIEHLEWTKMSMTGSGVLRSLQDKNTPLLDILVRESIQNSLDAAKDVETNKHQHVDMEYNTKQFNTNDLLKFFPEIRTSISRKFPELSSNSLTIHDKYTTGLAGEVTNTGVEIDTNFYNLVFSIMKPQQRADAGGSYGLGKTIYYRVGIGMVIYYTRVEEKPNEFVDKLAVCFIEDETANNTRGRFLPSNNKTGICWWGKAHEGKETIPLTNKNDIEKILDVFDIQLYSGSDTGTTIIIPFIDQDKLLADTYTQEDQELPIRWARKLESYLSIATQRWYAPRLNNRSYDGAYLNMSINKISISAFNMEEPFRLLHNMYRYATTNKTIDEIDFKESELQVVKKDVIKKIQNLKTDAGTLVYGKFNISDLSPTNTSLFTYIDNQISLNDGQAQENRPLICYTRKPGMIVNYQTTGEWVQGIKPTSSDEFIFGIFVLNSNTYFNDSIKENYKLEQYIRESERGDHMEWVDIAIQGKKQTFLSRIQKQIRKRISENYKVSETLSGTYVNKSAGNALASLLMPKKGFGPLPSDPKPPKLTPSIVPSKAKKSSINVDYNTIDYSSGAPKIQSELLLVKNSSSTIEVAAMSDSGSIGGAKWELESEVGTKFPLSFKEIHLIEKEVKGRLEFNVGNQINIYEISDTDIYTNCEGLAVKKLYSTNFGTFYGITIRNMSEKNKRISLTFTLNPTDMPIQPTINMFEIKETD